MINILDRIVDERLSRGWSEYELAKRSGVPQSTISSWYAKKMMPSFVSLEKICNAYDMTMAQFLSEGGMTEITQDQHILLNKWKLLTPTQKDVIIALMDSIISDR